MDETAHRLILELHNAGYQYVAVVTGGGPQAMAMLLNVPGASRALLEVIVPYHPQSLLDFLGHSPEQSCSSESSRTMATRALARAATLVSGECVAGIACTASLATDRPKKGDHRFHLSIATANGVTTWSLTLCKGARDREGEETFLDALLLDAMAAVFGVSERLRPTLLEGERIAVENHPANDVLASLYRGEVMSVCVDVEGKVRSDESCPALLLPGSFNPLHEGHLGIAEAASRRKGQPVAYEIGIDNVDKPSLIVEDVCRRVAQFRGKACVWLTRTPAFVSKAPLFPGTTFVLGYDTVERLLQARYYGDSVEQMLAALMSICDIGCRFLVVGRYDAKCGRFLSLDDVAVPVELRLMFDAIPECDFRLDVSSTQMRSRKPSNEETT